MIIYDLYIVGLEPSLIAYFGCGGLFVQTWNPIDNKKLEALSYLPPLTAESVAKEVAYMVSPCLEFDEAGQSVEKTAGCRDTTTEDTGHYGNYPCLDAQKHPLFSKKSMNARRHTQMLTFVCLLLTTRNSPSACRLSSINLLRNPMSSKCKIGRTLSPRPSLHV